LKVIPKEGRRGSVTIFVMIFFVTLISMIFSFIGFSRTAAIKSSVTSLGRLWGNSILAEYDTNLYDRYGLFGYYGYPSLTKKKLDFYAEASFKGKDYIDYGGCSVRLYDHSLASADVFLGQLRKAALAGEAERIASAGENERNQEKGDGEGKTLADAADTAPNGIIKNKAVLAWLPSAGSPHGVTVSGLVAGIRNFGEAPVQHTADVYLERRYMNEYFRSWRDERGLGRTFFRGEMEYVLCGKSSDTANMSETRMLLIGTREALNMAYLERSTSKSRAALAAAELMTPGPAAAVTQQALLAAWALAESVNDYNLLMNGYNVAVMKTDDSWAVDLDSVISGADNGCIYTGNDDGWNYEQWLSAFIGCLDERVMLLRMMDLIQINMKYLYYGDFDLKDYNAGLSYTITVNGDNHEFECGYR